MKGFFDAFTKAEEQNRQDNLDRWRLHDHMEITAIAFQGPDEEARADLRTQIRGHSEADIQV